MRLRLLALGLVFSLFAPLASARSLPPGTRAQVRQSRRGIIAQSRAESLVRSARRNATIALAKSYANDEFGVAIRYPSSWTSNELLQHDQNLILLVMFLSGGNDAVRQNVNLVIENILDPDLTLDEYTRIGVEKESQLFDDFTLAHMRKTTIAGKSAQEVVFTSTFNGTPLKFKQLWFFRRDTVHVWTFADRDDAFAQNVKTFDAMMDSLIVK